MAAATNALLKETHEAIETLNPKYLGEVLDFVGFLKTKGPVKTGYTEAEDGPFWSEEHQQRLRQAMADMDAGRNIVTKTWAELKAMENA